MRAHLADLLRAITIPLVAAVLVTIFASFAHLWTPMFLFDIWVRGESLRILPYFVCVALSSYAGWLVVSRHAGGWVLAGISGIVLLALAWVLGQGSFLIGLLFTKNAARFVPWVPWMFSHDFTTIGLIVGLLTLPVFVAGALGGGVRRLIGFGEARVA